MIYFVSEASKCDFILETETREDKVWALPWCCVAAHPSACIQQTLWLSKRGLLKYLINTGRGCKQSLAELHGHTHLPAYKRSCLVILASTFSSLSLFNCYVKSLSFQGMRSTFLKWLDSSHARAWSRVHHQRCCPWPCGLPLRPGSTPDQSQVQLRRPLLGHCTQS